MDSTLTRSLEMLLHTHTTNTSKPMVAHPSSAILEEMWKCKTPYPIPWMHDEISYCHQEVPSKN